MRNVVPCVFLTAFPSSSVMARDAEARGRPDAPAAMRCDPERHPSCPDGDIDGRELDETERKTRITYDRRPR